MKRITLAGLLLVMAGSASAQWIIYPAKGQSAEQQKHDQAECQLWATDTTGIDPVAVASEPAARQEEVGGERAGGAVKGALGGALIGAIAGDAGKGAAIGAGVGVLGGGAEQRSKTRRNEAAIAETEGHRAEEMNTFNRAFKVCMEGRGYSLN